MASFSGTSISMEIPDVGLVLFEESHRAKRLSIQVRPFYDVRVVIPKGISLQRAEGFVFSRLPWLKAQVSEVEKIEIKHQDRAKAAANINREQAKVHLADRLEHFSCHTKLGYDRVTVRRQTTRWGSCSSQNSISLNEQIILLPEILQNYVLLHELAHTKIHNHSRDFWKFLGSLINNPKQLDAQLRRIPIIPVPTV